MANVSISGAVSGIDTASLVNQLMTVEGQSQTNIKTKQTAAQKAVDAYKSLVTSIKALATQSAAVAKTSAWQGSSITSSSTAVTATVKGNATGTLTFNVDAVAAAHTLVSDGTVASTGTVVSGSTLTVKDGGGTAKGTIDVGGGTLAEVVAGVNASNLGLRAAAVKVADGQYRLQLTSATSGAASNFSVTGLTGFAGTKVLTAGADAKLTIGEDPATQYSVTSATNTFADVMPGISFTVSKKETNVTLDAKLDGTEVAKQISAMVDATNAALTTLKSSTAYDFKEKTGAALYGDNGIRQLQQQILSTAAGAGSPGISVTRDGKLKFDQDTFLKAFQADPTKTANAYGATSSFTPNTGVLGKAGLLLVGETTKPGTYSVDVTSAAAKEKWTATPFGSINNQTFTLTQGSLSISHKVPNGQSLADAVTAINTKATAAGISVTASVSGSSVVYEANNAGTASAFTASLTNALNLPVTTVTKNTAGADVVGMINGATAKGAGTTLTLNDGTNDANGISVKVDVTAADITATSGHMGDVKVEAGLARRLSSLLTAATDTATGSLTVAAQGRADDVKDLQSQIDAWDVRLAARRATLTRQFTAMETALASLKSSSSAITNLLASSATSS